MPLRVEARAELLGMITAQKSSTEPAIMAKQEEPKTPIEPGKIELNPGETVLLPTLVFFDTLHQYEYESLYESLHFWVKNLGHLDEILVSFSGITGGADMLNEYREIVPNIRIFTPEGLMREPLEVTDLEGNIVAVISWTEEE